MSGGILLIHPFFIFIEECVQLNGLVKHPHIMHAVFQREPVQLPPGLLDFLPLVVVLHAGPLLDRGCFQAIPNFKDIVCHFPAGGQSLILGETRKPLPEHPLGQMDDRNEHRHRHHVKADIEEE